jgi:hypothetical protein
MSVAPDNDGRIRPSRRIPLMTIEEILPTLATKSDLDRFATKADLREGIAEAKVFATIQSEEVMTHLRKVADGVMSVTGQVAGLSYTLDKLIERLEGKGVI